MPWRRGREVRRRVVAEVLGAFRPSGRGVPGFPRLRRHFHAVEGWCHKVSLGIWDTLLRWQRERGIRGHLLEIGVYEGKSATILAFHVDPATERLVLVDVGMVVPRVLRNLQRVRPEARPALDPIVLDSTRLPAHDLLRERHAFRWIHIDGGHSAACVRNDLEVAHELLAPDGIVAMDDFFDARYPHLTEATFGFLRDHPDRFSLFLVAGQKAYLARPDRAPFCRHFCLDRIVRELERRGYRYTLWKTGVPGEVDCFALSRRTRWRERLRGTDGDRTLIHTDARPPRP